MESMAMMRLKITVGGGVQRCLMKIKQEWVDAPATIDGVNALEEIHLGWYATMQTSASSILQAGDTPSVQVVFPDNTTAFTNVSTFTGYHLTQGAFDGAGIDVDIEDGSWGHFLSINNGVRAPTIGVGGGNSTHGMKRPTFGRMLQVGMDDITNREH